MVVLGVFFLLSLRPMPAQAGGSEGEKLRSLGAHLSSECATCHRPGGSKGIPVISGMEPEAFVKALRAYRDGLRANPVMTSVARSLTEHEMRALAVYFQG
jgi:cytochrome c553